MDYFWVVPNLSNKVLSKNKIKLIRSLELKKNRSATGLFVAEGKKLLFDLLESGISILEIYCTATIADELKISHSDLKVEIVGKDDLTRITFLKNTPEIVALCQIPNSVIDWDEIAAALTLVLDTIQDPGNLGTIIRLADWFGIRNIVCSEDCADLYNPKVVQSTMGAFARVKVHYVSLPGFLSRSQQLDIPIYGTYMEGDNLFTCDLTPNGIIIMGNEGSGISAGVESYISRRINIPSYPAGVATSESLNVAIATSVICSEFRRRIIYKG